MNTSHTLTAGTSPSSTIPKPSTESAWAIEEAKMPMYRMGNCAKAIATSVVCTLPTNSLAIMGTASLLSLSITYFREHSFYTKSIIRNAAIASLIISVGFLKVKNIELLNRVKQPAGLILEK